MGEEPNGYPNVVGTPVAAHPSDASASSQNMTLADWVTITWQKATHLCRGLLNPYLSLWISGSSHWLEIGPP